MSCNYSIKQQENGQFIVSLVATAFVIREALPKHGVLGSKKR